jgi:membrane peptidoglycan carboxypeptidase
MIARRPSRRQVRAWRQRSRRDLRRLILLTFMVLLILPAMAVPAVGAQTVGQLPQVSTMSTSNLNQDTLIYDRNGQLLADIGRQGDHRIVVPLTYVSPWLVKATLAIEDRTFYTNSGIDLGGIVRAAIADYTHHQITQGGSTISQQLVKQVFIGANPAPTLQRKLKEAVLAVELNRRYTKNQILEMYLNTIYYGEQTYGIEAAARTYFQSNAHDLDIAQAAMLAGLPQAPSRNDPIRNPTNGKLRQKEVLEAMVADRAITPAQASKAFAEQLQVYPAINKIQAPHFVDYVLNTLAQAPFNLQIGSTTKGYRVYTTLDMNLQSLAEHVVHDQVASRGNYYNFHDAALVSTDPRTGEILAMVGGYNYNAQGGQINMAVSPRQPGSSFKIFTYSAAIESRKVSMASPILDEPMKFPIWGGQFGNQPYVPQNYDRRFHGTLPLKMAMGNSLNIPALKTELFVGIPNVLDMARRMGITCWGGPEPGSCVQYPDEHFTPSLTLGGFGVRLVDMATAVGTLGTLGVRHQATPILSIQDGLGRTVYKYDATKNAVRAMDPQVAFIIASIMADDRNRCMEFGCHGDLTLPGRLVGAKTGTTESFKDNWTVGFTPTLAAAVWVGNPNNEPLNHNSTGIVGAAPIWHNFMAQALRGQPAQWYAPPAGLARIGDNYFMPGTENLKTLLSDPWPACKFQTYDPYTLTLQQMTVNGVPCVLVKPKPAPVLTCGAASTEPAQGQQPGTVPTPAPSPSCMPVTPVGPLTCPPGQIKNGVCPSPLPTGAPPP